MVEAQICEELTEGWYVTIEKLHIVSAIGAIEKSNEKIRLIHNASQPEHGSLNAFADIGETNPSRWFRRQQTYLIQDTTWLE